MADEDVLLLELVDETTELLDELLLGAVVPNGAHVAPRLDTSLNVSANEPLVTPYFVSVGEASVTLAL